MTFSKLLSKFDIVQKGYNSDILFNGIKYHIQTEDWGPSKAFLLSRVFHNGAIVKSVKTSYADILKDGPRSESEAIQQALKIQHSKILDQLLSGQL